MRLADFINTRESFSQVGRINGARYMCGICEKYW